MKSVLGHIEIALESLRLVRDYKPEDKDEFTSSALLQDAICMRLQVAGEELSKIRSQKPQVYAEWDNQDFSRLIGLRNIVSHQYAVLDLNILWAILTDKLQPTIEALEKIENKLN